MAVSEKKPNLQDTFLNTLRRTKAPVALFLVNGIKLQGILTWFDSFAVLLSREGSQQLVYKHAISTVMPMDLLPALTEEVSSEVTPIV